MTDFMDMEENDSGGADQHKIYRACDLCRVRKVKCDEKAPCSQCTTARKECKRTSVKRNREPRQRVLVSAEYERKIDRIEDRLDTLTKLLSSKNVQPPMHTPASTEITTTPQPVLAIQTPKPESTFEGESSLSAHSNFINDFLNRALHQQTNGTGTSQAQKDEMLIGLRQFMTAQKRKLTTQDTTFDHAVHTPSSLPRPLLPPFAAVAALLKEERDSPHASLFAVFTRFTNIDTLTQHCMDVYYSDASTDLQFIIVAGELTMLFGEKAATAIEISQRHSHQQNKRLCQIALETGLSSLPLLMPPALDTVIAVVIGALHAVGCAKATLAWTMTCRASELCQSLGYHRASSMSNDSPETCRIKTLLFWTTYFIDKGLSLRLGRPSTIQDYDIDIPLAFVGLPPWFDHYATLFLSSCRIQGAVYEKLYSARALSAAPSIRASEAHRLMEEVTSLQSDMELSRANILRQCQPNIDDKIIMKSDELVLLSVSTLILRVLLPTNESDPAFDRRCIDTARQALECHLQCMQMLPAGDVSALELYINWTVLYTPFVPFIVLFCHIIETGNKADLSRLRSFVDSLEVACGVSQPAEKLHRVFDILCNIASRYLELCFGSSGCQITTANKNSSLSPVTAFLPGIPSQTATDSMAGLSDDWLCDYQQIADLLQEDDLRLFGTNFLGE